jgi:hypothetical protein
MLMWQLINEERETLSSSKSCTHICIEILQNNKYDEYMIVLYDTMHYGGSIIHKYHMHDTSI